MEGEHAEREEVLAISKGQSRRDVEAINAANDTITDGRVRIGVDAATLTVAAPGRS